ncbi:hypothetical protein SELMODRAFT_127703 [Selaginella moellendorffii]|uniref:Transmembrane protein 45B n=1 Tax=Selaginella moellendorffii TaxID=88036 RepID=D8SY79_SELML|nr:transmembrane protein 45A [Selaginella moellendorffii]EFJ10653.1 hypothetical protein SELMODRAFT_127703 [Selaginella moellendorffii]|eukprot:XP_002988234.1 transmembrane protein 45A [Selaginella moellendorffii]
MGTLVGHVAPGIGFALIGLWHLVNIVRSYIESPSGFEARPWFPVKISRRSRFSSRPIVVYAELYLIIFASALSIASELFIWPEKHQPLADDLSIPANHLNNFEHSSMSFFFLVYAAVALVTNLLNLALPPGTLHLLAALAFSQELLLFHFHSADHMGLEGQYHWLLQLAIAICLLCTVLEISRPSSVLLALVRAVGILFQGLWLIQMGLVLWIPRFVPTGCRMVSEDDHDVVRCADEGSTMRAKALANLQFSWYLAGVVIFSIALLCALIQRSRHGNAYARMDSSEGEQEFRHKSSGSHSSIEMEEGFPALELGR